MRILVTRPLQDGQDIAARLAAMGHQALLAPLLTPHFADGPAVALEGVQAILATSANGIRALVGRCNRRDIPIFAVGPQTAQEARLAGFVDVRSADGDASDLALAVAGWATPEKGALLHVCGAEAPGTLAQALEALGFVVRRETLYRVEAANALPGAAVAALKQGQVDAVMFFSPRSGLVFLACLARAGLSPADLVALCISPATAAALDGFAEIRIAERPNQAAMLALVAGPA